MQTDETVNVTIPKALLEAIDSQAKIEFRNRGDLIREAARYYIAQKGGSTPTDLLTTDEELRIQDNVNYGTYGSEPTIILSCAYRPQPNAIKNIFTANSRAMELMERPPKLRNSGWDLETQDRARPIAGGYLEVKNEKKLLRLYRDGQHTIAGGMNFFGNAANNNEDTPINFNLLSVAELITNFVTFSKVMGDNLEHSSGNAIFTIAVSNPQMMEEGVEPRTLHLVAYNGVAMRDTGDGFSMEWAERNVVSRSGHAMSIERIAYLLYSEFCYFFGVRNDEIPYVNKKLQEIDKSKFRWIAGS